MILLTQSGGWFFGPIAKVLGWIFNGLFELTSHFGILNVGIVIILFTIVVKILMLPLTVKQAKFSKLSSIMNPELMEIQKKYSGKTDQASIMKMQEEQRAVQEKYGVSPMAGCFQLIIQMPILIALYRVIQNIPAYVTAVKDVFVNMIEGSNGLMAQPRFAEIMAENFQLVGDCTTTNSVIDTLNRFTTTEQWDKLIELFPQSAEVISENVETIFSMYDFFGINLSVAPTFTSLGVLIPILTVFAQWISMKVGTSNNNNADSDNPAAQSMKTMNTIMPLMTGFIAFSLPNGLGLYWISTAVCQTIQQLLLNLYFNKIDINEMIKKNVEKANAKRVKQGLPPQTLSTKANTNTKNINNSQEIQRKLEETKRKNLEKVEEIKKSTNYYNEGTNKGGLAAKANMVAKYNEKNNKK